MATEFDGIHSIQRALAVGSVDRIITADQMRPYLIDAVERGMAADPAVVLSVAAAANPSPVG